MQRSKDAKLSERVFCWFLRTSVVMLFALLGLGLWAAAQGNTRPLGYAPGLLISGSMLAYFARALADRSGAYSRVGLLNDAVYLYSLAWLPTVGAVGLWRLTQGDLPTTAGALVVGGACWALGHAGRVERMRREQAGQAA